MDFGAFVKLTPNKDGLVHISEIKKERVNKVEDHLSVGDIVKVKLLKIDNGKLSLSIKALL
jgi:polyribonucleotide nucleotidyltransferase